MEIKARTKPFRSKKTAVSFSKIVNGKVTVQKISFSKKIYHVHYKSNGIYKGKNNNFDLNHNIEGYTHNYEDI